MSTRNIFRLIEHTPMFSMHKMGQSAYTLASYLSNIKSGQQAPPEVVDDDKDDLDISTDVSLQVGEPTNFQPNVNAYEFAKADFDFIRSDHMHICSMSELEFRDGMVDIMNMDECVSIIVDDDDMLYGEDF